LKPRGLLTFEFRIPFERFLRVVGEYERYPYLEVNPSASLKLHRIFDRLRALPLVESVAGISSPPINSYRADHDACRGRPADSAAET
jgi:hypothetical protein